MRAIIHLAGNVAPVLAGLVTAPLTARALGPASRGELAIVLLVSVLIGLVGAFGMGPLARQAVSEDISQARGWSRRGQRITVLSSGVAAACGIIMGLALGLAWLETVATAIFFALAGMSASKSIDANILIVGGRTKHFGIANLTASGIICAGIVASFLLGWLNLSLVVALNAAALIVQMLYISVQRQRFLGLIAASELKKEPFRVLAKRAWRAWRSQLVEAALLRSDSLLFITQATVTVVGYYAVVALIPQMLYQVFLTLIQHSYASAPGLRIRQRTTVLWQFCTLVSLPLTVLGAGAAMLLVPLLFGPEFLPSLELLGPACCMAVCVAGLAPVLQHFAISPTGDAWFPLVCIAIATMGWVAGTNLGAAAGVIAMAAGFAAVSCAYVYLLSGMRAFSVSFGAFARLYGRGSR